MPQIELKGKVSLDGSGFDRTLGRLSTRAKQFTAGLSGMLAGFFTVGYLTQMARKTAEYASKVFDLASAHKVSVARVQEYDHAAQQNGTTVEKLIDSQRRLAKARADALANPGGDMAGAFGQFGFDRNRLAGLTAADDLMRQFSDALKGVTLDLNSIPAVLQLIGDRNSEVIPALVAGLAEAADEAHRLGLVMQESVARRLDEISDSATVLQKQLTIGLAPALMVIANWFVEAVAGAKAAFAFIGGFTDKFASFAGKEMAGRDVIAESFKAAKEAAAASIVQHAQEQQALIDAQERKDKTRALSIDDLMESRGVKERIGRTSEQAQIASSALNLNDFQRIGAFAGESSDATRQAANNIIREIRRVTRAVETTKQTGDIF